MAMKIEVDAEGVEYFDFKSPYTNTDNIEIRPIGISYTYRKNNDNTDLKNKVLKDGYDRIEYIGNVLIKASHRDVVCTCLDTGIAFTIEKPIDRTDMLKYLKKHDMEPIMRL